MATESHPGTLLVHKPEIRTVVFPAALIRQWWVAFTASTVFVVCGHLLIKAGLNAAGLHPAGSSASARILHLVLQPHVIEGLLIYLLGTACWMTAVAQKEISFLYPLTSINYVMVVATSALFFHEAVSVRRAAGVAVIVLGMVLMNRKSRKNLA
jgi:drug/metabolite transporter (DMT)-like permease